MPKSKSKTENTQNNTTNGAKKDTNSKRFHLEFLNSSQKIAWGAFEQHDVLFLLGAAGTGKTHLAMAFAINEILTNKKEKIVLTRPIVEAGEKLGFLPGDLNEKVNPYMMPLWDCMNTMLGPSGPQREKVAASVEVAPLAYMRGRTFNDAICIFDEAQNSTKNQLKMFLTRLGKNSKMIVTGDPMQSDLGLNDVPLREVVNVLETVNGIGIVKFDSSCIVRHKLVGEIIKKLEG